MQNIIKRGQILRSATEGLWREKMTSRLRQGMVIGREASWREDDQLLALYNV